MYLVLELELRGLWGAWASDHKGPNKPDERAVMSSASRRRDNTSDGGGVSVTGVALEHHHDVIWWGQGPGVLGGTACTMAQKVWGVGRM